MSVSEGPEVSSKTPAGARVELWWWQQRFDCDHILDFDELAAVALNTADIEPSEPVNALSEVLKGEFPMFQGPDTIWKRVARGMIAKLESLRIFLVYSPEEE